jgi:hypothetical protein
MNQEELSTVEQICTFPVDFRRIGNKSAVQMIQDIGLSSEKVFLLQEEIEQFLHMRPDLVEAWLTWSDDKRVTSGWYFTEKSLEFVVGFHPKGDISRYRDKFAACAEFMVHEFSSICKSAC